MQAGHSSQAVRSGLHGVGNHGPSREQVFILVSSSVPLRREWGRERPDGGLSTALPLSHPSVQLRGEETKPHLCLPTKNSLSVPFEDLGLGKSARSVEAGLRFRLRNESKGSFWPQRPPQDALWRGGPLRASVQDWRWPCPKWGWWCTQGRHCA